MFGFPSVFADNFVPYEQYRQKMADQAAFHDFVFRVLPKRVFDAVAEPVRKRRDLLLRRGHYWREKLHNDLRDRFIARLRDSYGKPDPDGRIYNEILQEFIRGREELERSADTFQDELRRSDEIRRPSLPGHACDAPRAKAVREQRRSSLRSLWRNWARHFAEAFLSGKKLPAPPSGRMPRLGGLSVRRLCERSVFPPPDADKLLEQYEKARGRGPVEEKLRLGSMLLDLEAVVDSSLVRDESGAIIGRTPGLRGWIDEHCRVLLRHYASLMKYRRLADAFRRAHGLRDPIPAAALLGRMPAVPSPYERLIPERRSEAWVLLKRPECRTARGLSVILAEMRVRPNGAAPPWRRRTA